MVLIKLGQTLFTLTVYREIFATILFSRLNVIRENKTAANIWQCFSEDSNSQH